MINHFRTLILNRPPLAGSAGRFSQYVPSSFSPLRLEGVETAFRNAIFGEGESRDRDELISTMVFRLIMDFEETAGTAIAIDPRISFNHRDPIIAQFDTANSDALLYVPGEELTFEGLPLTLSNQPLQYGEQYVRMEEPMPIIPSISQMWGRVGNMLGFRALYSSNGQFSDTLADLSRLVDSLKRDDHKLATAACAYCLRLTERL